MKETAYMTNNPAQTTYRNMPPSEAVTARVQKEAEKLGKYFDRITSCLVVIEAPHGHNHHHGEPFHVRIELGVPGKELVVNHCPSLRQVRECDAEARPRKNQEVEAPHKDVYVAIRDAFLAARRQLQDYVHCLRHEVKTHAA
jgi:ribosome-associated translation inhibitor RaiA